MKNTRTHYDNLQVSRHASQEVIRAAYKSLMQKWHPDRHPDRHEEAQRIIHIISQAFEVLSDPIRHRQHDEWIEGGCTPAKDNNPLLPPQFSTAQAKHRPYSETRIGGYINLKV